VNPPVQNNPNRPATVTNDTIRQDSLARITASGTTTETTTETTAETSTGRPRHVNR